MLKRLLLATAAMATLAGTTTVVNHPTNIASAKVVHHKKHVAKHHGKKHVAKKVVKKHGAKKHVVKKHAVKKHTKKHQVKLTNKQLGILAFILFRRAEKMYQPDLQGLNYWTSKSGWSGMGGGTAPSTVYYKLKGKTLYYAHAEWESGKKYSFTKKISYANLIKHYYSTRAQKALVAKGIKNITWEDTTHPDKY